MAFWDNIFSGLSAKQSAVSEERYGFQIGTAQYVAKASEKREKFAPESMKSVIAYAAVRVVSKAFSSVDLYTAREDRDGNLQAVQVNDFAALMRRPNPLTGGAQFMEMWATYYSIHGEGPIERVLVGNRPRFLYCIEPENIAPVPSVTGIPSAYEYKGKSGERKRWPVDVLTGDSDVRFIKAANPIEPNRGLAPTWTAGTSIDAFNAGTEWNAALLQNKAQPSGVLKVKQSLTETQRERLKGALEDRYAGPSNSGRPMVLEGDMDWQQIQMTPAEMDWIESNRDTARRIALAYGVPPQLLGIPGDNTYANMREARLALYDETVLPLLNLFCSELTAWLGPLYGQGIIIRPDTDQIEALDYRRERRWERVQTADFLTVDEKREALGYEAIGAARGGDMVPAVQQWSSLDYGEDVVDPEEAGREAYGDGA